MGWKVSFTFHHAEAVLKYSGDWEGNPIMKVIRVLATMGFVIAGIASLVAPLHAAPATATAAFAPTRFSVVDLGKAGKPDVVLIPGMSCSRVVWEAETILLGPDYRLHLVQVNGFADAPAGPNASGPVLAPIVEELHAYIAANKLHPVVIGHSLGGLLAMMLAEKYPEDVRKMVIVDALPYTAVLLDPAATVEGMRQQTEAIRQQMLAMPADQYAAMQPMMAARMVTNIEAQKQVAASFITSDRAVAVEAMVEDLQTDLRRYVASIKTPTLVLYAYDETAQEPPAAKYEAMVQDAYKPMPNVTLVRIDNSRHFIMYDQPMKLNAAIEGFLK
jgi:pimeloyl-ACP methyl ester carboxylesterase